MTILCLQIKIPDNLKWVAVNYNGEAFGYEDKPVLDIHSHPGFWLQQQLEGDHTYWIAITHPPKDFTDELYEVKDGQIKTKPVEWADID